jgi:gluconate kinase
MSEVVELGRLFVVTGIQGAGKSTVGRALAGAFAKAVFIDGDTIADMVVSGHAPMSAEPSQDALEQLLFRYAGALVLADTYRAAGFDAVVADNIFGDAFVDFLHIAAPETVHLVVLHPSAEVVRQRDEDRGGNAYRDGFTVDGLWDEVEKNTPRLGLWLDTSEHRVEDTVLEIIQRQHEAVVDTAPLADE